MVQKYLDYKYHFYNSNNDSLHEDEMRRTDYYSIFKYKRLALTRTTRGIII